MTWINLEGPAYWTLFVAAFVAVAVWESYLPKRALSSPAERRWGRHGVLMTISAIAQFAVFQASPVAVAVLVEGQAFGLLNQPWLPFAVRCALGILALDLAHYVTHRAFHSFSWLWRVHEVHHSDPDYDVSTAGRFHPVEVVLTQGFTFAVILLLAPPAVAVLAAGLLGAVVNLFAHANACLPGRVEKLLRLVFITPDMHRIHHYEEEREQTTNLGQIFGWWDRLFGTYLHAAARGDAVTGVKGLQTERSLTLAAMLGGPFRPRQQGSGEAVAVRRSA